MSIDPRLEILFQEELDRLQPGVWSGAHLTAIEDRAVYFSAKNERRDKKLGYGVDLSRPLSENVVKQVAAKFRLVDIGKLRAYNLADKTFDEDAMESPGPKLPGSDLQTDRAAGETATVR